MSAEANRHSKPKPRNERRKRHLQRGNVSSTGRQRSGPRNYHSLVLNYFASNGNERKACIQTGFAPSYATELFRKQQVKNLIEKLRPEFEKELIQKVINERQLSRDFLDLNLMNVIANGETHFMRGDADRVKAIEVGYKAIGDIQPTRVIASAQAQTAAISGNPKPTTFLEVYKSAWLIKKEQEMAHKCEQEYSKKNS